jgi:MFS family permease
METTPRQRAAAGSLLLLVNVAAYALCFMMQHPVLPFLTKSFGADLVAYGTLQTWFSLLQTVSGLAAGPFMDAFGPRWMLLASYGSSAVCYAMTGSAQGMTLLYASRVPTLLQHAIMATRTMLTEWSSEAERARTLGFVGVAYGIGMSVGPALGGSLSAGGNLRLASWVAAVGSVLSLLSLALFLPKEAPRGEQGGLAKRRALEMGDLGRVTLLPGIPSLLTVKFLTGMATAIFQSAFPLFVNSHFALDARGSGLVMSFTGVVGILTQAFAIDAATRRLEDRRIVQLSALAMLASLGGLSLCTTVPQLLALLAPFYVASSLLSTVNTAQLTKAAPLDSGTVVAIDMSVGSACRMLSPSIASYTLQRAGYSSVCGLGAGSIVLLLVLLRLRVVDAAPHTRERSL